MNKIYIGKDYNTRFLSHYASPYYDPVKAHEYYEAHKQLKGRRTTSGLNDRGKEAARYVKESLNEEKKQRVEESKQNRDTKIQKEADSMKNQLASHVQNTQSKINALVAELKNMPKTSRSVQSRFIQGQIAALRNENAKQREKLNAERLNRVEGHREEHKQNVENIKNEYEAKYESELEKIQNDPNFKAVKKGRGRKRRRI